jgi:L-arabinokinase
MLAAHASYGACGLGAPETDLLVALCASERIGGAGAVAGAKITGGGSGGTVAVLCRADAEGRIAEAVARAYADQTGNKPS